MLKGKKFLILLMVICCICVFSGCGAMAKISRFYGTYVCISDKNSVIEFTDFDIPKRTGVLNYHNINFPSYGVQGYSESGARVKVFKRKGRSLIFSTNINGKEVIGSLNVDKKLVSLDGIFYVKQEF